MCYIISQWCLCWIVMETKHNWTVWRKEQNPSRSNEFFFFMVQDDNYDVCLFWIIHRLLIAELHLNNIPCLGGQFWPIIGPHSHYGCVAFFLLLDLITLHYITSRLTARYHPEQQLKNIFNENTDILSFCSGYTNLYFVVNPNDVTYHCPKKKKKKIRIEQSGFVTDVGLDPSEVYRQMWSSVM